MGWYDFRAPIDETSGHGCANLVPQPRTVMSLAETQIKTLPTLNERPHAYVVIFDGHCRFCLANMRWLRVIDCGKVAYVSLHDPIVGERWPDLTRGQMMSQIYLIDDRDRKHGGAAAFRYLSRKLISMWLLAPFLHIPMSLLLWQFLYKQIARIRYRFGRVESCDDGSCSLHFDQTK